MAFKGGTCVYPGKDEVSLSNIGTKPEDTSVYDELSAARSDGTEYQTIKTTTTTPRLEVIVTRRMIVLAMIGLLLLSTLISVIVGVTVYTFSTSSCVWKDELALLKSNLMELKINHSEIRNKLTTHLEIWKDELTSCKSNLSESQKYSKDCNELYAAGTVEDGVYTISPDGRCPFKVYCDMVSGGWTLIQKRQDGSVNFYRSWNEYEDGFGNIGGEHWLGLDKIHRLTADGSQIYFHLEYYNGTTGFAHYQAFSVHGAISAYRMNVDEFGYNGTINELFSFHNNMKFSTYDRDNDALGGSSCVKDHADGGGWWYNNCWRLGNLNGVFGKREVGGIDYYTGRQTILLKSVNIKIKPYSRYC